MVWKVCLIYNGEDSDFEKVFASYSRKDIERALQPKNQTKLITGTVKTFKPVSDHASTVSAIIQYNISTVSPTQNNGNLL